MFELINLDDLNEAELLTHRKVFLLLAHYCEDKHRAMRLHRSGDTEKALIAEESCESLYHRLPVWARW